MCLDVAAGNKQMSREEQQITSAGHTIHGGGSKLNSGNRWFDKTIQVVSEFKIINFKLISCD